MYLRVIFALKMSPGHIFGRKMSPRAIFQVALPGATEMSAAGVQHLQNVSGTILYFRCRGTGHLFYILPESGKHILMRTPNISGYIALRVAAAVPIPAEEGRPGGGSPLVGEEQVTDPFW